MVATGQLVLTCRSRTLQEVADFLYSPGRIQVFIQENNITLWVGVRLEGRDALLADHRDRKAGSNLTHPLVCGRATCQKESGASDAIQYAESFARQAFLET